MSLITDSLAFAGDSDDSSITNSMSGIPLPFVGITSISSQAYYWTQIFTALDKFTLSNVQFSTDAKLLAVLTKYLSIPGPATKNFINVFNSSNGKILSSRYFPDAFYSSSENVRQIIISSSPKPMVYVWAGYENTISAPITMGKTLFKYDPFN